MSIERAAEAVEDYVGIPLTEGQRRKLQRLADTLPTENLEDLAALALELGVDRLLEGDGELEQPGGENPTAALKKITLMAHAFEHRADLSVPGSLTIRLTTVQRYVLEQMLKARPELALEAIAKMIVSRGVEHMTNEASLDIGESATTERVPKTNPLDLAARRAARNHRRW